MDRHRLVDWFRSHPGAVHGDPAAVLERAEREARRRAARDAWLHARAIAERQLAYWNERSKVMHSSEEWAAREVCHELARELRHQEPEPDPAPAHWLEPPTLAAFEPGAREALRDWLRDVAREEEHRVWREVVRFTDGRARTLVQEGRLSTEDDWEHTPPYAETAVRLAAILVADYDERARAAAGAR